MALKKLVAGNWKMHGLSADLAEVRAIADAASDYPAVDVALCVPAVLIERAARAVPGFAIGGQDVHPAEKGAHTGCTSAQMLLDAGARLSARATRRSEPRPMRRFPPVSPSFFAWERALNSGKAAPQSKPS